jgi:hypothetical protein
VVAGYYSNGVNHWYIASPGSGLLSAQTTCPAPTPTPSISISNTPSISVTPASSPTPTPTATPPAALCYEYAIYPDAGELAAADDGYIYFSYFDCSGIPTTLPLNASDTTCVDSLNTTDLYYFVGGNPTACVNSYYVNTLVSCL